MTIEQIIVRYLKKHFLTQKAFAELTMIHPNTISRMMKLNRIYPCTARIIEKATKKEITAKQLLEAMQK